MGAAPPATHTEQSDMSRSSEMGDKLEFPLVRGDVQWVPDSGIQTCQCCKQTAVGMGSRHHCRKCGIVCCKQCTIYQFKGHRVCKNCISLTDQLGSHVMQYVSNERLRWVKTESISQDGSKISQWQPAVVMCELPSDADSSEKELAVCTPRNTLARVPSATLAQSPPMSQWRQTMVDLARAYTELADSCSILSPNLIESNTVLVFNDAGVATEYKVDTLEITEEELYVVVCPKQDSASDEATPIHLKFHLPDVRSLYSVNLKSVYSTSGMPEEEKVSAIPAAAEKTIHMGDEDLRRGYQPAPIDTQETVLSPEKEEAEEPLVTAEELQRLRDELNQACNDLEISSKTVHGLNQEKQSLKDACESEKNRADNLENELNNKNDELVVAEEMISSLNDQIQTLTDERTALEQRLEDEASAFKDEMSDKESGWLAEKEELQKQLNEQTESLAELNLIKSKNEELDSEVQRLQEMVDSLKSENETSTEKVSEREIELSDQFEKLNTRFSGLLESKELVELEAHDLRSEVQQLQELVDSLQSQLAVAKEQAAPQEKAIEVTEATEAEKSDIVPEREEEEDVETVDVEKDEVAAEDTKEEEQPAAEEEENEDGGDATVAEEEENDLGGDDQENADDTAAATAASETQEKDSQPQTRKSTGSQSRRRKRKKSKRKR